MRYKATPLGANQLEEIEPAREATLWLYQNVANNPLMQRYLEKVPVPSQVFAINRAVDYVRDLLYTTLEPWRIGRRWRDFEDYADYLIGVSCWVTTTLNDDPCVP